MATPCSKRIVTLNLALYTLFRNDNCVQSCPVSVYILRPIRPVKMYTPLLQDNFIEMSEIH